MLLIIFLLDSFIGTTVAVTAIFSFQTSGFGSSLTQSKERITGLILGSAYSYLAVVIAGSAVARVALTVAWTFFAMLFLGYEQRYLAQASVFAVSLAFYSTPNQTETFFLISGYLIANTIAICILIAVGGVGWLISLSVRPRFITSIAKLPRLLASTSLSFSLDCLRKRSEEAASQEVDAKLGNSLRAALKEIRTLQAEAKAEPSFMALAAPQDDVTSGLLELFSKTARSLLVLESQWLGLARNFAELESFGLLNANNAKLYDSFSTLDKIVHDILEKCAVLASSMNGGAQADQITYTRGLTEEAGKALGSNLVISIRSIGMQTSIISSRAMVRLVSYTFSILEFSRNCDALYPEIHALALAVRTKHLTTTSVRRRR